MNLQAEIKWIQNELNDVKDPKLIQAFKNLLKSGNTDQQKGISIDQYNKELEASEKEIETGNFYTQNEVRKIASRWGKR